MKNTFVILFLLFLGLNGFGQSNKIEVSQKVFLDNSIFIDTVEQVTYYPDQTIKKVEVFSNITSNINGVERRHLYYSSEKKFKSNGQRKSTLIYEKDKSTKHIYDHKGRDSWIYIREFEDPNIRILTISENGTVSQKMDIYTEFFYYTGELVHKKVFKKGKKHGRCEFYDDETGALKKVVTYIEGKKVSTEKFEL